MENKLRNKIVAVALLTISLLSVSVMYTNCSGGGGGGGSSGGGSGNLIQVTLYISSGGITVGSNQFKFDLNSPVGNQKLQTHAFWPQLSEFLLSKAYASTVAYRVSPDKAKLRITNISLLPVEQNVDTSTEGAFNSAQVCEVDYDSANPNQTTTCVVEIQVGLHYEAIDFKVAPNVDILINDSNDNIYTTAAGLTSANPGANLGYYTATYGNNTDFHAYFPFQVDTTKINTTLSKTTTTDGCSNTVETKMFLSDGTVLSDVTSTPATTCNTPGTTSNTVSIGTQNLNIVVDMIHGIEVDSNSGTLTVNTQYPWWTVVGTIGTGASIKHYASTASNISAATYSFPPTTTGINELKVAYANGVAVEVQMIPNGYSSSFCHDDYDTPSNSPGNGYVGSDGAGVAWAVGPWSNGSITNYTSEYYLNTSTGLFSCKTISADPNPSPGQTLDTFSSNMPNPSGFTYSETMKRIDQ